MPTAQLTSANLHDPVLSFVRPVPITLRTSQAIGEAHAAVRAASARHVHYFYVLDDDGRLAGVMPVRHLLAARLDDRVDQVMIPDVVAIPSWATVLIASEYFATRRLKAFPVIHDDGTLAGTVDIGLFTGEVINVARETYDEIFQLLGVHATAMGTPWTSYLDRFPWLLSNITGGLLCAFIAARFEAAARTHRGARALHSDRAGIGRERQHAVRDADAAEPLGRVAQTPAHRRGSVERGTHGGPAGTQLGGPRDARGAGVAAKRAWAPW